MSLIGLPFVASNKEAEIGRAGGIRTHERILLVAGTRITSNCGLCKASKD
jgi:hypothetical protein